WPAGPPAAGRAANPPGRDGAPRRGLAGRSRRNPRGSPAGGCGGVSGPVSADSAMAPREALAAVRVRAPLRGNRRLERLLDAANADDQLKAWWHVSAVNATRRLGMSDHSWVHIQIVLNIGLRLGRLLFRRGVQPSIVRDYAMSERDAEVVIAAGCLFHCVGMSIHRDDHERYSLFLTA